MSSPQELGYTIGTIYKNNTNGIKRLKADECIVVDIAYHPEWAGDNRTRIYVLGIQRPNKYKHLDTQIGPFESVGISDDLFECINGEKNSRQLFDTYANFVSVLKTVNKGNE